MKSLPGEQYWESRNDICMSAEKEAAIRVGGAKFHAEEERWTQPKQNDMKKE